MYPYENYLYSVKRPHTVSLKFGDTFLNFINKLLLEAKASMYSSIKKICFLL